MLNNDDLIMASVKKGIGIDVSNTDFDSQLLGDINTAFLIVYQIGVGTTPYAMKSVSDTWSHMFDTVGLSENEKSKTATIKKLVVNRVKQFFDPAGVSSSVNGALTEQNAELEWRINNDFDRTEDV